MRRPPLRCSAAVGTLKYALSWHGRAPTQCVDNRRMGGGETGGVFLAGAAAGIFEGIVVQPMEMVKTRFQINAGAKMRIIPTMRAIIAEGGMRQLYRGGLPEIAGLIPRSSAMWSGYELSRRELTRLNGGVCNTQIVAASGVCAGCCEGVSSSL